MSCLTALTGTKMKLHLKLLALLAMFAPLPVVAISDSVGDDGGTSGPPAVSSPGEGLPTKRPGDSCSWEEIGAKWNVSPLILYAIARTESNLNPGAINRANKNGSEDVGMMQINSFWYKHLQPHGISRDDLFDACVNLDVAGWVLAHNMELYGNTWRAVGAYNARSPNLQALYVKKIYNNLPR